MEFDPLPQQRLAIEAPLGPVLVLAGPGVGKTFCLIARINHLINTRGLAPERICAVTFTNRAAEEIAVRLKHTLGDRADGITRGTIHALCLALLREHAEAAGLRKGFGVADEQYQKVILGRLRVPLEQRGPLLNRFGRHRVQAYELTADDARLYREYTAWLAHRNMVDFDDLVTKAEELLRRRVDVADAIAARWDYLLVDEFQDVNAVQYDLLKRLAAPHGNFFAVGDDEQSIFTWTGADPYVLVRFGRDYGIDRPIVLDKNCRCSRQIFETARRVLAHNPQLFEKQLSAEQESPYEVTAVAFREEAEEASWLLEDLRGDRAASGLGWGDYAILYRTHKIGEYVEGRLVRAGIPCRLARGRSLVEDDVIRYVITALRIVRDPDDPVALEAFARCVLSEHFLQEVQASPLFPLSADAERGDAGDFLAAVRTLARRRPAQDPDTKKLWRLVYQVENLRALSRSHRAIAPLVDEILSQSVGPYRNALEERHDELTDPAECREAVRLAERLEQAIVSERNIAIEPQGGLEIALRGMLVAAGVRQVPSQVSGLLEPRGMAPGSVDPGEVLGEVDGGEQGLALTLFKALQLLAARELDTALERYVTFDLETTDTDVASCGVVEIGAARVVQGEIVDRFHTLVNRTGRSRPGRARSTATLTATCEMRARLPRCGPSFEPSWATTSSSRTTASGSISPCCAGSRPAGMAWTAWCSTTPCRWFARCRATAASWRISRCASASTAGERIMRWTTRSRWRGCIASSSASGEFGRARQYWRTCSIISDSPWRSSREPRQVESGRRCSSSRSSTRWADTAMRWRSTRRSASAPVEPRRLRSTR